jgi:glycosyltransferase involved in cell wall biosynthesis
MRIAHLPSSYLPESLGGTEVYVHHLAEELARQGHESAVVVHGGRQDAEQPSALYQVVRLPGLGPCSRAELYGRLQQQEPPGFADFLDDWRPDVVHFHAFTLGAGLAHARLARKRGIPYVVTYHTPTFSCAGGTLMHQGRTVCDGRIEPRRCAACVLQGQGWPRPVARLLGCSPLPHAGLPDGPWLPRLALPSLLDEGLGHWREFMDGAAAIVACAPWCRDVLVRNGIDAAKISVHRQALPGPARTRKLRLPLPGGRPLRLGFFGRFCWIKGPDLLLDAASRLHRQDLETVCELAGPIPDNERRWANRLLARHAAHAIYKGTLRDDALRAWLRSLDLVVIPSRWLETGPLTLLEAWDEGVPVVGANLGGIADFLNSANLDALAFEPENPASLADAIIRATRWSTPAATMNIPNARELVQRTVELYESLLAAVVS